MLDSFLKVAYDKSSVEKDKEKLADAMKETLSKEMLLKVATGEVKLSYMDGHGIEWLEKFKGTPLFDAAVQLEQEAIQQEVAEKQQQQMSQANWDARDQICMKKRLLGLQLAMEEQKSMTGAPAAPTPPAPGPGTENAIPEGAPADSAPGPKTVSVKLGEDQKKKEQTEPPAPPINMSEETKTAGVEKAKGLGRVGQLLTGSRAKSVGEAAKRYGSVGADSHPFHHSVAQRLGEEAVREKAKSVATQAGVGGAALYGAKKLHDKLTEDRPKEAVAKSAAAWAKTAALISFENKLKEAAPFVEMGKTMAKTALSPALAGLGQKALGWATKNPGAALGGAVGAIGGLAHGLQKDEHGQRHLLRGAAEGAMGGAAGAAAGHVAQGTHHLMGQGLGAGEAAQTAASAFGNQLKAHAMNLGSGILAKGKEMVNSVHQTAPVANLPAPQMG